MTPDIEKCGTDAKVDVVVGVRVGEANGVDDGTEASFVANCADCVCIALASAERVGVSDCATVGIVERIGVEICIVGYSCIGDTGTGVGAGAHA